MYQQWKNNAYSQLAGDLTSTDTDLAVQVGYGDRFPAVSAPTYFLLTLQNDAGDIEIVKVTARSPGSDSMTVVRAQEGTVARPWAAGDIVELRVTAAGLSGLVTLSDPETLTNKTIVVADNTITTAPSGNLTSTELNAALAELQSDIDTRATSTELDNHINDAVDAHMASAIGNVPAGNIAATTVQGAIDELDAEKQPASITLTALAALNTTADKGIHFTGSGTAATHDLSPFARTLLDDTTQAQALSTLGAVAKAGDAFTGGMREALVVMGSGNNIDINAGNYFAKTISTATTFTVSNVPPSGTVASFILDLTNGGSAAVTWWSGVKWAGGTAPTLTVTGRDVLGFFTYDGGVTWTGLLLGKDVK